VVECTRLEIWRTVLPYREFESHPLRQTRNPARGFLLGVKNGTSPAPLHAHVNIHAQIIAWTANPRTAHRRSFARMSGKANTNQLVTTHQIVGRVKRQPTRTRQIDLQPRMRVTSTDQATSVGISCPRIQIARNKFCGIAKLANRFDH
jgi:hypothetical protein